MIRLLEILNVSGGSTPQKVAELLQLLLKQDFDYPYRKLLWEILFKTGKIEGEFNNTVGYRVIDFTKSLSQDKLNMLYRDLKKLQSDYNINEIKNMAKRYSTEQVSNLLWKISNQADYLYNHYKDARVINAIPDILDKYQTRNESTQIWIKDLNQLQLNNFYGDLMELVKKYDLKISLDEIKNVIPLDAPANIIHDDGWFDNDKFIGLLLKYKDQFMPKLSEEKIIELAQIYLENEMEHLEDEDDVEVLKKFSVRDVIQHFVGALEHDGYKLKEIKNINRVTPEIVWNLIRDKYKEKKSDAIVDIGFLFEEFGYMQWVKDEQPDYEEYRRTNTSEKMIFLKYLQGEGRLDEFYKKLKAL